MKLNVLFLFFILFFFNENAPGDMAQWLQACHTLAEDLSSDPNTYVRQLTISCNSNSRELPWCQRLCAPLYPLDPSCPWLCLLQLLRTRCPCAALRHVGGAVRQVLGLLIPLLTNLRVFYGVSWSSQEDTAVATWKLSRYHTWFAPPPRSTPSPFLHST